MFKNIQAMLNTNAFNKVFSFSGDGSPISGKTGIRFAGPGSIYTDKNNGVQYLNEGTLAVPYWTPTNFFHPALLAGDTDWRDGVGKAHADTAVTISLVGSGIRIFGDGIAETDSGVVVTRDLDAPVARATTTDEDNHLVALSLGSSTVPWKPADNGPMVIDAEISQASAITLRRNFLGFLGTAADALVSPATGATITITLVQDDLAGLFRDVGLTDSAGWFTPHNKANAAASIAVTDIDTGIDIPAAGTYQRLRVEITEDGDMRCYIAKTLVMTVEAALSTIVAVAPVLLLASTSIAVKTMDVKRLSMWAYKA